MSSDLEWKIEEGESPPVWPSAVSKPPRRRLPPWRWQRWLVIALALAVVIGAPAAWLVNRLNEAQRAQRQAVLEIAQLEDRLLAARDYDALRTLQDENYLGWRTWYTFSSPHDIPALPGDDAPTMLVETWSTSGTHTYRVGPSTTGDVRLSGELAELTVTTVYTPYVDTGPAFTLRRTRYYRSADGGWVRTGPPPELSRNVVEVHSDTLILRYLRSDASIVEPLVARLLALTSLACRDIGCTGERVTLSLSADPQELLQSAGGHTQTLYAPAPALLGAPVDDAGYDALYRLYGTLLVTRIAEQAPSGTSEPVWWWLHWELTRLRLEPALAPQALQQTARNGLQQGVNPMFLANDPEANIWLALDFLAAAEGRNPLRDLLADRRADTLQGRLLDLTEERNLLWWSYLEQTAALPVQYPGDAQLAMVCDGSVRLWNAGTGAQRPLNLAAAQVVWSADGGALLADIPNSSFALLDMRTGQTWHSAFPALAWAPGGRVVVRQNVNRFTWDPPTGQLTALAAGTGWTAWSPDELSLAYARGPQIYLASPAAPDGSNVAANVAAIAAGASGLWSPDSRYLAIIGPDRGANGMFEIYDTAIAQLLQVPLPAGASLTDLAWAPDAARLAIATVDALPPNQNGTVRVIDLQGQALTTWVIGPEASLLAWAPDGTRVGWLAFLPGNGFGSLFTGTIAAGDVQRLDVGFVRGGDAVRWGWSPDGQWIAVGGNGVTIWSSDFTIQRPMTGNCRAPAWRPARK